MLFRYKIELNAFFSAKFFAIPNVFRGIRNIFFFTNYIIHNIFYVCVLYEMLYATPSSTPTNKHYNSMRQSSI